MRLGSAVFAMVVMGLGSVAVRMEAQRAAPGAPSDAEAAARRDGETIAARAIARRREMLGRFRHVRYDAYVKVVVRAPGPTSDSAAPVLQVAERRSSGYWAPHGRFQETVLARRGFRGAAAPRSLVVVGGILDFDRARVVVEATSGTPGAEEGGPGRGRRNGLRYALWSPLAESRRGYGFRLLDTVFVDGRRAYRIAVEPASAATPAFAGTMDVADSTYDVLTIDLGVNDAVRFAAVEGLRLRERWDDAGDDRWMPAQVRLTGEVRPKINMGGLPHQVAGVPIRGLPERLSFEQRASFSDFRFDDGPPPRGLGEFRTIVRDGADDADSAAWTGPGVTPLTDAERAGYARAAWAEWHPSLLVRVGRGLGGVLRVAASPGFFHYNRVDGYYLGAEHDWRAAPSVTIGTGLGCALGSGVWQYHVDARSGPTGWRRVRVGAGYHDQTVARPTLVSRAYNPTYRALFAHVDPLDYFRERGFWLAAGTGLLDFTRLDLRYDDVLQTSLDTLPGAAGGLSRYPPRGNPAVAEGRLRAVSAILAYDSRQFVRSGGRDVRLDADRWTRIALGLEVAAPSIVPDDFSYRRYAVEIERRQPMLGLGTTGITVAGGVATGAVPPQRYFTVDFGMEVLAVEGTGFGTLDRTNYYGTRAAMLTVQHDFGQLLFRRSGLPLVRDLPFTLRVNGGVFWADFAAHAPAAGDSALATAGRPYREVGFALGNLTPFLSPLNFAVHFAWQLSSYPTRRFRFGFGITGP
jgi:hypothetical protein